MMIQHILSAFGFQEEPYTLTPLGNGLINSTWKIKIRDIEYVLQKVNVQVFKNPEAIAENVDMINTYLQSNFPGYLFTPFIKTTDGKGGVYDGNDFYRMSAFVPDSMTLDYLTESDEAYEAAKQFGRFTKNLSGFDATTLKTTLPQFHDLSLRYQQYEEALQNGDKDRIKESATLIEKINQYTNIVTTYADILNNPAFKLRVTHHDTKISNVLFNKEKKAICVIDLDTVMPGYFISDVGDMMRTYLSPVSEEEKDFSKTYIREDFFVAIYKGYMEEMGNELSAEERQHFIYGGKFMIYMQALRFITDHINNDVYYGAKYEGQNFVRTGNQMRLLEDLFEKEDSLNQLISGI